MNCTTSSITRTSQAYPLTFVLLVRTSIAPSSTHSKLQTSISTRIRTSNLPLGSYCNHDWRLPSTTKSRHSGRCRCGCHVHSNSSSSIDVSPDLRRPIAAFTDARVETFSRPKARRISPTGGLQVEAATSTLPVLPQREVCARESFAISRWPNIDSVEHRAKMNGNRQCTRHA